MLGKGAIRDVEDSRDLSYDEVAAAGAPMTDADWQAGFDIEKKLNFTLPIKNQFSSSSCVGQGWSYYTAILNLIETGKYDEVSAKAIYSQIFIPSTGGAQLRDGAKLIVNWGAVLEKIVKSYKADGTTDENFMRDLGWITPAIIQMAKMLQAKEYRMISGITMDIFAQAIRDNNGIVAGVEGTNNGTWLSNEPKAPTGDPEWGHCLYFGKYGVDSKGKYIATPNSWGTRKSDVDHPDGWQRLREEWFANQGRYIFSPWTLVDKPNITISNKNMITIKKQGEPTIYALIGDIIVPFVTDWGTYTADFGDAKIIEVSSAEFAKFKLASAVQLTKK